MKKLTSEFLTEEEANTAKDKISSYCASVRLLYGGGNNFNQGDDYFDYLGMNMLNEDFYGFSGMGPINFGGFGMTSGWGFGSGVLDGNYNRVLSRAHLGYTGSESGRATLEAEVANDNVEYVRNKLYSLGAVSVT